MKAGVLHGIGVGPGDPDLITVKGAALLSRCEYLFVPKARPAAESLALRIAERHVGPGAEVRELVFPMLKDRSELEIWWGRAAGEVAEVLREGHDACFLTLGDPLLYSTYIYLIEALKEILPEARIETVPGIAAMNAAAALTGFALGEGKETVTVVPAADDLSDVRRALGRPGTVVLMKIGKRLQRVLEVLGELGLTEDAVFVCRAGLEDQRVETDVRRLRGEGEKAGYLSIMLVHVALDQTRKELGT